MQLGGMDDERKKNLRKRLVGAALSLMLASSVGMGAYAATFAYPGTVTGDGVRLRTVPDTGTVLELMYSGERVYVDKEMTEESGAAYYLKRAKTGTVGYGDFHYIRLDYEW